MPSASTLTSVPITFTGAAAGATGAAIALGPVGWTILGTEESSTGDALTWDCWKPILHDTTEAPSAGRFLREVIMLENVKSVTERDDPLQFRVENIWGNPSELIRLFCQRAHWRFMPLWKIERRR